MAQIRPSADGGSEVVGLAPGQYQIEAASQTGTTSRIGALNLNQGSVALGNLTGEAAGSLSLSLVTDNGAKLPAQTEVILHGIALGAESEQRQTVDGDGKISFSDLPADDYQFLIFSGNHVWQTLRIEEGEKPSLENHRRIAAGESATLKLVVAGPAKAVAGLAVRGGRPMAGAMIVLVPVDAIDRVDLFRRDQSDLDGTFALRDVSAGRYIVIAIADGWTLEWGKIDVLSRFLGKGVAVVIPANERNPGHLPQPIEVQGR